MFARYGMVVLWVVAGMAIGCDRGQDAGAKPSSTPPTTQPNQADLSPATAPATQPSFSELTIDGHVLKFPAARLRVGMSNGQVIARLYTDDPKSALKDDYQGNGYYLVMKLDDIREPHEVFNSVWTYQASSRAYVDSPFGIFLQGIRYQLQPYDVKVRFLGDPLVVRVDFPKGQCQFLQFDQSDPAAPPKVVEVEGHVLAPVEYKD